MILSLFLATAAWSIGFQPSVAPEMRQVIRKDMLVMQSIQASRQSPLHSQVFQSAGGKSYVRWFSRRIRQFSFDPSDSSGALAWYQGGGEMIATKNLMAESAPQISRIMTLIHEARHAELAQDGWPHVACPKEFLRSDGSPVTSRTSGVKLAGELACGRNPLGAYGVSEVMMRNLVRFCENCSEKFKMDAELFAADQDERLLGARAKAAQQEDSRKTVR